MVYLTPSDRCFIFSLQRTLASARAIVLRDGDGAPQEVGFWTAYCAGLIALLFVEQITALVQGVNLEDIVSNGWQAYAGVLSIPASGIFPPCSCSSVCSLAFISSDL